MLSTTNLTKQFGDHCVLDGISLHVKKGEVAVIVGPSGGGKSTFLRCLNGLETFDGGSVEVDGITITPSLTPSDRKTRLQQVRQRVGMVFQQFNLFPHRTVLGNVIEAPTQVLGQSREAATVTAQQLLDRVGLREKLNAMPDTLSGGQQQRVAIARALAMHPQAILFDEPTSALDPRMAAEVEAVIADLASQGQTMVVVTHSMHFARRTAHTLHIFERGELIVSGPANEIFKQRHDFFDESG